MIRTGFRFAIQTKSYLLFSSAKKSVNLTFFIQDTKTNKQVNAPIGNTILEVVKKHKIPIEGICEGNCSCGTCHVIFQESVAKKLSKMKDDEKELLDTVSSKTENSRLGCQIKVSEILDGAIITVPPQNT